MQVQNYSFYTSAFDFIFLIKNSATVTFCAALCLWCTYCKVLGSPGDPVHPQPPECTYRIGPRLCWDWAPSSVRWHLCKSVEIQGLLSFSKVIEHKTHLLSSAEMKLLCGLYCVGFLYMLHKSRSLHGSSFTPNCANIVSILVRIGPQKGSMAARFWWLFCLGSGIAWYCAAILEAVGFL